MRADEPERWRRLSPLLEELMNGDAAAREQRLAALRDEDASLANAVEALLRERPGADSGAPAEDATPAGEDVGMAGKSVGAYTVERQLGLGGMGSVWLARRTDGRFEGHVAIKFLNGGLAAHGGPERFAREGRILARLAHANIARLLDAGVDASGTQPYLVLEYIDGERIDDYCERHALSVEARVRLCLDVLAAVAHAHNRLILHRDLKPSNILVTAAGEVKLLDFGIAKLLDDATVPAAPSELTQAIGRAFTLQYAAPEQVQGGDVTTATDVYALGVLLYVLLAGMHPTSEAADPPLVQMRAVIEVEPRRLSDAALRHGTTGSAAARLAVSRALTGDLDNIVAKALKKAPGERYANAAALADDLRHYLNHEPVAARPDALGYRIAKFVRRHRLGVAAGAVTVVALGVGIGVALWEAREAGRQRVQAEGLVEFMLGDLRKKLQPVGRLDVLDAVGTKALDYYGAQDIARLDADSLGRRARALHLIGEIAERRGSLDEALRVFRRAAESTSELMARYPRDGQRIFDHAQSVYWVGYVARQRGRLADAETSFSTYQALARQLVALDASNLDWRMELAFSGGNLGVVYLESSRYAQALATWSETRDEWVRIVTERPDLGIELAKTWGWIAKAREALGEFDAALDAQQTKIGILRKQADVVTNRPAQVLLANASHEIGRLQLALGRYVPAEQAARESLAQYEALLSLDGSNAAWRAQMTFARISLAEIQRALGHGAAARENLDLAAADVARLTSADDTRNRWNIGLRGSLLLNRLPMSEPVNAQADDLDAFLAAVKRAESSGKPLDEDQTRIVARAELMLGDVLASAGRAERAQQHWRAAAERLKAHATSGELVAMTLLAHARWRLGEASEARALAARIEASPYRHPVYADLRQRLDAATRAAPAHS